MAMASKLVEPSIAAGRRIYPGRTTRSTRNTIIPLKVVSFNDLQSKRRSFNDNPFPFRSIFIRKVAEQSSGLIPHAQEEEEEEEEEEEKISQMKQELYEAVKGINRGIFGVPSAKKTEIERLVEQLKCRNPTPEPAGDLDKVRGCWRLIYSTITILGPRRTKLGLRDFVSVGDILQQIDVVQGKSVHVIKFNVRGLNLIDGALRIDASFKTVSESTAEITYESSTIMPDQLMNMFRQNYDLLLGIFNPEGRFEILYPFLSAPQFIIHTDIDTDSSEYQTKLLRENVP